MLPSIRGNGLEDFIEETMMAHKVIKEPDLDEIIRIGEDIMAG